MSCFHEVLATVDGRNPAPPKKPFDDDSPANPTSNDFPLFQGGAGFRPSGNSFCELAHMRRKKRPGADEPLLWGHEAFPGPGCGSAVKRDVKLSLLCSFLFLSSFFWGEVLFLLLFLFFAFFCWGGWVGWGWELEPFGLFC